MNLRRSDNKLAARVRAFNIIKVKSYAEGDFVLASGKRSKYYLDLKPTMFDPEGANVLANLVIDFIKQRNTKVDMVGGLEMGAVPLVSAVTLLSLSKPKKLPGFFVRKEAKDHGTKKLVETAEDLTGKNVVILDDVTTSGGSAMSAVDAARKAGANVVLVLSVVDREEGAAEFYAEKEIPFKALFRLSEFKTPKSAISKRSPRAASRPAARGPAAPASAANE
jgi:orotate phosphoribosyltransferase